MDDEREEEASKSLKLNDDISGLPGPVIRT